MEHPASFAARLDAALSDRQVTMVVLRERMANSGVKVSLSALSQWRSGKRVPTFATSFEAVALIEELLDLEPGSLVSTITPRPAAHHPKPAAFADIPLSSPHIDDAVHELPMLDEYAIHEVGADMIIDTDADNTVWTATVRQIVMATKEGASRIPFVVHWPDHSHPQPQLLSIRGGRQGERVDHPEHSIAVFEILLTRPLPYRHKTIVEVRLRLPLEQSGEPSTQIGYYLRNRMRQCTLWVRFPQGRSTTFAECSFIDLAETKTYVPCHVGLDGVSAVVNDLGPGRLSLDWEE